METFILLTSYKYKYLNIFQELNISDIVDRH